MENPRGESWLTLSQCWTNLLVKSIENSQSSSLDFVIDWVSLRNFANSLKLFSFNVYLTAISASYFFFF